MIVTEQKPISEILENLENEKNIFLIGCGECSTLGRGKVSYLKNIL